MDTFSTGLCTASSRRDPHIPSPLSISEALPASSSVAPAWTVALHHDAPQYIWGLAWDRSEALWVLQKATWKGERRKRVRYPRRGSQDRQQGKSVATCLRFLGTWTPQCRAGCPGSNHESHAVEKAWVCENKISKNRASECLYFG
mgnify:CR=1 FL=1